MEEAKGYADAGDQTSGSKFDLDDYAAVAHAGAGAGAGAGARATGVGASVSADDYLAADAAAGAATAPPEGGYGWSRPVMTGVAPKARGGHAAALVGNLLIVVGGHYYGGNNSFVYLDDVWAIDVDTMTWHNPACAGGGPSARYGHTASVIDYKLYVFGGRGPKGAVYNDLWCLDVERWTWERMSSTTAAPSGRFGHSQLTIGSKLVYFGGWDGSRCFNDLWVYDTEAFSWLKPRVGGTPPRPRFQHISEFSPDGRIIIFGGAGLSEKGHPQYLRDVKQLNTETMVWSRCRVHGDHPTERSNSSSTVVANTMVVFGGWRGVRRCPVCEQPEGASVSGEMDHQPDCPAGKVAKPLEADGKGGTKHPYAFVMDLDTMEWRQPFIRGALPTRRYGHSTTAVENRVLIFGGWDGNRPLNDVLQLDLH